MVLFTPANNHEHDHYSDDEDDDRDKDETEDNEMMDGNETEDNDEAGAMGRTMGRIIGRMMGRIMGRIMGDDDLDDDDVEGMPEEARNGPGRVSPHAHGQISADRLQRHTPASAHKMPYEAS